MSLDLINASVGNDYFTFPASCHSLLLPGSSDTTSRIQGSMSDQRANALRWTGFEILRADEETCLQLARHRFGCMRSPSYKCWITGDMSGYPGDRGMGRDCSFATARSETMRRIEGRRWQSARHLVLVFLGGAAIVSPATKYGDRTIRSRPTILSSWKRRPRDLQHRIGALSEWGCLSPGRLRRSRQCPVQVRCCAD